MAHSKGLAAWSVGAPGKHQLPRAKQAGGQKMKAQILPNAISRAWHRARVRAIRRFLGFVCVPLGLVASGISPAAQGTTASSNGPWPSLKQVLAKWGDAPFEKVAAAAEGGEPTAQHYLGYCYEVGLRGTQDPKISIAWYERAMRTGYMPLANNLGVLYEWGKVVPRNL